ncbi:Flavoprotein pyridine nucleotide cytochrome reductase-like, FAD-binding domain [Dillenia turbinata]|uniref:NADH-cytochrome b5 reductase n=1 Tax=Dillenia turbinata TaxID=194707 RepID=A0AAN8Z8L2_9MAGN
MEALMEADEPLTTAHFQSLNSWVSWFTNLEFSKMPLHAGLLGIATSLVAIGIVACYFYCTKKSKRCLDPKKFKEFKLIKRTQISHNTARFRFALPTPKSVLGLPVGQHIRCRGKDSQGNEVIRPYTPITLDSDIGYFELVVKMYPNGKMSHHFREMKLGDYLAVIGPQGKFKYKAGQAKAIGMLAGGTGITPMFQLTKAILQNRKDKTKIHLLFGNVTVDDILLKEELEGFAGRFSHQFEVYYVLSQPPEGWNGGRGYINKEMIQSHCPAPATDILIMRCGPPPMNKAMAAHLDALGYTKEMQFEF